MWHPIRGHCIFRATMSYMRFSQIRKCMRFDDKLRRDRNDSLAAIRQPISMLNASLARNYIPGPFLCVDEQLVEFHGRVSFRQYIPSKPGKFGIKIFWLVDQENSFPLKCLVYIGAGTLADEDKNASHSIGEAVVMKLAENWLNKGRNITADNWFTTTQLADRLLKKRTTIVGTMRRNNRSIPPAANSIAGRRKKDSVHYLSEGKVLCSFWDKKRVPVLLLSTMHSSAVHCENKKPEIVEFYNGNKGGVDTLDKLCRSYRCQRKSRRWSFSVFMALVDVGVVAAMRTMEQNELDIVSHFNFKCDLGFQLAMPLVRHRATLPNLKRSIKDSMRLLGVTFPSPRNAPITPLPATRCGYCTRQQDRKTRMRCSMCSVSICKDHASFLCPDCS